MRVRTCVLGLLLAGATTLTGACDEPRVTESSVTWPDSEGLRTIRAHLHADKSGVEARELFPDMMVVFVDEAQGKKHPVGVLPFKYYWSPSGRFTAAICNVGKTVFVCPYYVSSRLTPVDFGRCDVEPVWASFEQAPSR